MNRATKWDWIMAWVGVLLAFAIIGYVSRVSDECKAKGGVYAKVRNDTDAERWQRMREWVVSQLKGIP